jgi:hypothetical protein
MTDQVQEAPQEEATEEHDWEEFREAARRKYGGVVPPIIEALLSASQEQKEANLGSAALLGSLYRVDLTHLADLAAQIAWLEDLGIGDVPVVENILSAGILIGLKYELPE